MNKFGINLPLWQNYKSPWQFFEDLFGVRQNDEPTLANFYHLVNYHCCKWPNIEQVKSRYMLALVKMYFQPLTYLHDSACKLTFNWSGVNKHFWNKKRHRIGC